MGEKITYILGAGASVGAFPLVKKGGKWERSLAEILIIVPAEIRKAHPQLITENIHNILEALKETGHQGINFGNIDSYAKYLYHTNKKEQLMKVKIALTFYFVYNQLFHSAAQDEKRYLNFITSMINSEHRFPENVKILSWNYDFLVQNASALFGEEKFSEGQGVAHRSPAFLEYFPHCGYEFNLTHNQYVNDQFSLVHLNGIAGFYIKKNKTGNNVFSSIFNDLGKNEHNARVDAEEVLSAFDREYSNIPHLMTFAWETNCETKSSLSNSYEIAKKIIKDTTTLVVIGYSFPFYNREVDNMIFDEIKPTLKKIYYQDPTIDGTFLDNRYNLSNRSIQEYSMAEASRGDVQMFRKLPPVEIEHIPYVDQFYIPVEL